jgi:uncharacterized protein
MQSHHVKAQGHKGYIEFLCNTILVFFFTSLLKARWIMMVSIILISEWAIAQTKIDSQGKNQAKPPKESIRILSKVGEDGVWLRWAPTDFMTWQWGNKYGYTIQRYTLLADGTLENKTPLLIGASSIKPFTTQQLDELSKSMKEATALQELIYNIEPATHAENPAALLEQNEQMDNRFGMTLLVCDLSIKAAEAAGLFWNDKTAVKGARYIYKIAVSDHSSTQSIEPAVAVVEAKEDKPLQPFKDVSATFADKKVTLSWSTLTHTGVYSAYIIEKSEDGKNFTPTTDLPYTSMSQEEEVEEAHFVDSLSINDKTYHYQVRGITPFGEKGPPSNMVSGTGKANLIGMLILREVKQEDKEKKVVVRWEFPVSKEAMIKGFVVSRASKSEGPYADITPRPLPASTREMIDLSLTASAYYQIKAVDATGQEITHSQPYFLHVEDNVPPAIPTELSGVADKKGIVTLKWAANTDDDLMGYRVFSSNSLKHEFVEVTRKIVPISSYSDTINLRVLNKNLYYVVVGVDKNFNASGYSISCKVVRPDVIAPVAPVFGKIEKKDGAINLKWVNSISDDVVNTTLYRTTSDSTKTMIIKAGMAHWGKDNPLTSYADNTALQGKTYQYVIEASDSTGNIGSVTSKQIIAESGIREDVTELKALIDRENKIITLKWNYNAPTIKSILYRKKNEEPFSLYQTLDGPLKEFTDKQVIPNNTYSYKLQLVLKANVKTKLSESLKVPF